MALHAVLIIADAFFQVLFTDLRAGMLVAAVTGRGAVVVVHVAFRAFAGMVQIEAEIAVVLEHKTRKTGSGLES
jgi:hypothetical protein